MNAGKAKVGQKYLSPRGTPIVVVGHKGDKVILKISNSDNEIHVAKDYELKPFKTSGVSKEAKVLMGAKSGRRVGNGHTPGKESLSSIIDPMLFGGGKSVKEIADVVTEQASALAKGKDVEANVRARMVSFSRKGWKIEKDDKKQVRVIKPKD